MDKISIPQIAPKEPRGQAAELSLPSELVSLIHHVELDKAGWWNKALQRLILGVIWLSDNNAGYEAILERLQTHFQVRVEPVKVGSELEYLRSAGLIVRLLSGAFKIAEGALKDFERQLRETEAVEKAARERFTTLTAQHCPGLDPDE